MINKRFELGYNEGVCKLSYSRCTITQFDIKIKSQIEKEYTKFHSESKRFVKLDSAAEL